MSAPKPWCGGAAVASSSKAETSTVTLTIIVSVIIVTNRVTNVYQNTTTFITVVSIFFGHCLRIFCHAWVSRDCDITRPSPAQLHRTELYCADTLADILIGTLHCVVNQIITFTLSKENKLSRKTRRKHKNKVSCFLQVSPDSTCPH